MYSVWSFFFYIQKFNYIRHNYTELKDLVCFHFMVREKKRKKYHNSKRIIMIFNKKTFTIVDRHFSKIAFEKHEAIL